MAVRGDEVAGSIEAHVRDAMEKLVGEIRSSIEDVREVVDSQLRAALQSVQADVNAVSFLPHIQKSIGELEESIAAAQQGLSNAVEHLTVSHEKLLALQKGMSEREVAHLLGKPIPGWQIRTERPDSTIESWYYRRVDGGIAGVYFRDGALFAAEENSQAKVAPLM